MFFRRQPEARGELATRLIWDGVQAVSRKFRWSLRVAFHSEKRPVRNWSFLVIFDQISTLPSGESFLSSVFWLVILCTALGEQLILGSRKLTLCESG